MQEEMPEQQFKIMVEQEHLFQQSPFNSLIYKNRDSVLGLFLNPVMKTQLCQYIKVCADNAKDAICNNNSMDEKSTAFLRGYVKALNEILNMPAVIHNRMDREANKGYREVIAAYEDNLRDKELNN